MELPCERGVVITMNAKERIYIEREREDRRRMMQLEAMKRVLGLVLERIDWEKELDGGGDKE